MAEQEVPPYFLCPISLQIMKDPVTLSTGITYDRDSIQRWISSQKNLTCPVTNRPISSAAELTPNIILCQLIQSWSDHNPTNDLDTLPVTTSQVLDLFHEMNCLGKQIESLLKLRSMASSGSDRDKRVIEATGACTFLETLIIGRGFREPVDGKRIRELSLAILHDLQLSKSNLKYLVNSEFLSSVTRIMRFGSNESRTHAVILLKSMFQVSDSDTLVSLKLDFFKELARVLSDHISKKATKATLKLLIKACQSGRNRMKAVEAGIVSILIDLLLDSSEKRISESILIVIEIACQCADGRAELLRHSGGLAVVSKNILRISDVASEKAVRILYSVSRFSGTPAVVAEMMAIGDVEKLCLLLHVDYGAKTKEKAREMLQVHAKAWRNASCIPEKIDSFYTIL